MKKKKKALDIFNLSFLDIISCGFGAVVLLVLISNRAENSSVSSVTEVEKLLQQVTSLERNISAIEKQIVEQKRVNTEQHAESEELDRNTTNLALTLSAKRSEEEQLQRDVKGLALVQSSLNNVSIRPATTDTTRDDEVGGIPVDSDYVIFVVDTSGSMLSIWDRVSKEILNTLSIHPQVKGFQILNDQGKSLISGYSGRWIPDTPQRRRSVMQVFKAWRDASNSSPIEGIESALRLYAKDGQSMAIYVFGDDYTGSSYDQIITKITKLNRQQKNGQRLAKIHGVGFLSEFTTGRFGVLMRELTKQNGGTFLALPF